MVEPSYFLACPIFHDAGFEGKLSGVPEDEEGLDIEFLHSSLQETENEVKKTGGEDVPLLKGGAGYAKLYKHLIYLVPTFSNPSAKTLSLQRREELVRLARQFDALVVTDDVYDVLRWPEDPNAPVSRLGKPPPRIVDVDATLDGGPVDEWGNTVSNGSFSKIIAPGCRVGWAEGTAAFAKQLSQVGSTRSGGAPSHLVPTFVHEMLVNGTLDKHITETLVPVYRARYYVLMDAIREYLVPLGFELSVGKPYEASLKTTTKVNGTNSINSTNGVHQNGTSSPIREAGGFFTYLLLPAGVPSASDLATKALDKYELKFAFGDMFQVAGDVKSAERAAKGYGRGIRLCWAWHTEEDIKEGIRRLAMISQEAKSGKA
ncbi:PLP-dependent transferase [Mytilinidion resinicola]|uniref:PLP-dependent transferase n=1 Tax=Mytilinidion resinicola TaxID=574789 RepID=A0A6A6Y8X7_9PEZI|nr:PLP-dependent transferase [Mytilinidion resinicola]KAF2805003.1 PLP-dependent transferase [Mytilinidion resinicola]